MFKPRGHRRFRLPQFHHRGKRPLAFRQVFMISFIIFMVLTVWGLWLINEGIKPTLMAYANTKTVNLATKVINTAINKQLKETQDNTSYVSFEKDNNGEIRAVTVNTANVNMLSTTVVARVQSYLQMLEKGKLEEHLNSDNIEIQADQRGPLITSIPLGLATKNSLLANLGPQVPVRFQVIGNVNQKLVDKKEPSGINWMNLNVYVLISVDIRVIIPFATKPQTVTGKIPLVNTTVHGDVPLYYSGSQNGNSPSITLPSRQNKKTKSQQR